MPLNRKLQHLNQCGESESHSVMYNSLQPHELYSARNSLGQNTGVGSLYLLRGIFPTQGPNPGLPHCRGILYQLSHKGRPSICRGGGGGGVNLSLLPGIFLTQESNRGLLLCRWILYQLRYQGSPSVWYWDISVVLGLK